ncbi:hypothetical protein FHT76_008118 [Rhizobium sp. BK176]|nr:hypothetical protein [Rhizobium sp. BK181]MBB3543543.1 hypothetical protein [Rhizobium sp. BK399]MCS4096397.1 hypothetical protein [Rhizobium sp. BK176]
MPMAPGFFFVLSPSLRPSNDEAKKTPNLVNGGGARLLYPWRGLILKRFLQDGRKARIERATDGIGGRTACDGP